MATFYGQTDKTLRIQLQSYLLEVLWGYAECATGGVVPIEARTAYVADGSKIMITVKDMNGGTVETIKGKVYSNFFRKQYKVKPNKTGGLFFEADMRAHGLRLVSQVMKVLPPVGISGFKFEDEYGNAIREVEDGQDITLSADVKGLPDGTKALIYWPLSTAKNSYTLWIYYHRLNDQTLHLAIADFIDPKLKSIRAEISMIRESGKQNSSRLEELLDLEKELADFHDEIERIIKLPWKPNLNDGVLITASPLWKLFRFPKWQKDLRACWEKLEAGDYDWAHLAYSIWPKRVEKVCETDRSIAIAHDLEHLCKVEAPKAKKPRKAKGKKAEDDADSEVVEDTIEGEE
jgi:hypothetical protein